MPLDSIVISAVADELRPKLTGAKIDKIRQPERDTVLLSVHGQGESLNLLLCGGVGNARIHITKQSFENPQQPPMFCMLLRKHLVGARIAGMEQPLRERLIIFHLDAFDEMGFPVKKQLVLEMIGRGTNLILVGPDGRIIDCLRRVDSEMSSIRQVLPGLIYRLPLNQTKPDLFSLTREERENACRKYDGTPIDKWLLNSFSCLSPLVCREMAARCGNNAELLPETLEALCESVSNAELTPWMISENGRPKDFSYLCITQYGGTAEGERYPDFSSLLDAFFTKRSKADDMHRRTADLRKTVKNARDRVVRKLALQRDELEQTKDREQKRRWGDLITANLYRIKKSDMPCVVEDFYEPDCPQVQIPMDKLKTPQENAAAYYRAYTKAKTAEQHLTSLIAEAEACEFYLNSVLDELDRAASEDDIREISRELRETGYLKKISEKKVMKSRPAAPLRYRSTSGFEILVGRSNHQNDELTHKTARKGDLWFHTLKIHGSHVIVCTENRRVDEQTIHEAAILAATHSQASGGGKVSVDYTDVRYVKKPANALPGMVIYSNQTTITVQADEALAERLLIK